jgi:hypothetical protein
MVEKMAERSTQAALDLGRLLGFKRVAALTHDDGGLAEALGGTCNKVGEEVPGIPAAPLAQALGAICNKVGEETG